MLKQLWKFLRGLLAALAVAGAAALIVPRLVTTLHSLSHIYSVETAPPERAVIVFGAGLSRSGRPTPILRDRVQTAADLYFAGKVEKLLMSGGERSADRSEPQSMREYAMSLGVPAQAIVLDPGGQRTYDTCYRAKAVFGLDSALLVTQGFHLPRALFVCNALGLKAEGVEAANRRYWPIMSLIWNVREQFATLTAMMDLYVSRPQPAMDDPQPMFSGTAAPVQARPALNAGTPRG